MLPRDLMCSILQLPDRQERIRDKLAGISEFDDDWPDHTEFFWTRQRDYADQLRRSAPFSCTTG
ncbi:hypothetical protein BZM27_26000 [Paraburkholderia steynii]|uniref:Uncharacterized protein n=1 Tax=Paraburkholderia steynii TaxID=1245441 RepID=A0A4R0X8B3_9BURK|nr:hypothetical protein BZM27_26000 [Paraburkholderia steynii]